MTCSVYVKWVVCFLVAVFIWSSVFLIDSLKRDEPEESSFDGILHTLLRRRRSGTTEVLLACNQTAVNRSRTNDPPYDNPAYRFHVLIYGSTELFCGGVVLNEHWVVSAASCLKQLSGTLVLVVGYQQNVTRVGEQTFSVQQILYHQNYSASAGHVHNSAMINIVPMANGQGIQFSNRIQPICLSELECTSSSSLNYTMTGVVRGGSSSTLEVYSLTLASNQTCLNANVQVPRDQVCARKTAAVTDSCDGFLGGPVIYNIGGVYKLAGVVSSCHRNNIIVIAIVQVINCAYEMDD